MYVKSGLIDEMIGDTFAATEADGLDEAADREVDRIMTELTADILKPAGQVPTGVRKPAASAAVDEAEPVVAEADDSAELEEMQRRLQALS